MKKIILGILLLLIVSQFIGCGNKKEIEQAKAKYELAETNGNLEEMFLALKELSRLKYKKEETEKSLIEVKEYLTLYNEIKTLHSEHNHEELVKKADKFLKKYPNNSEVKKYFIESGQIFAYLEIAKKYLEDSFSLNEKNEKNLIMVSVENDKGGKTEEVDFEKIYFNLDKANKYFGEAKKLDPYFKKAISLEKMVSDFNYTFDILLIDSIETSIMINEYFIESAFITNYNGMVEWLKSDYLSPQSYWRLMESANIEFKNIIDESISKIDKKMNQLNFKKENDTLLERKKLLKERYVNLNSFSDEVFNPKGSMIDYKNDVNNCLRKIKEIDSKVSISKINKNELEEKVVGFSKILSEFSIYEREEETKPVIDENKDKFSIEI